MIHCMINAHNLMTAFDDAGASPYGEVPVKVMLGDNGPFEVDRVEVDVSDSTNPLGLVLYVTDSAATEHLSTADAESTELTGNATQQPAEVDPAYTPQPATADQVPASGGSGGVSSSTGPEARRDW